MTLFLHIIIAISSLFFATYTVLKPTQSKLRLSGGLTAATIATGTYLVLFAGANLLKTCATGLLYTGVMFYVLAITRNKLVRENARQKDYV
jgi:hypothetical protein